MKNRPLPNQLRVGSKQAKDEALEYYLKWHPEIVDILRRRETRATDEELHAVRHALRQYVELRNVAAYSLWAAGINGTYILSKEYDANPNVACSECWPNRRIV